MRIVISIAIYVALVTVAGCGGGSSSSATSSQTSTLTTPSLEMTSVFKTGQTKSYSNIGVEVLDGSLKDDGYYQKGMVRNFARDDALQVVTDNVTGLMWQDDIDSAVVTKQWVTDVNYSIAKYDDVTGDTAATYCASLNTGGFSDWRLPRFEELLTITNRAYSNPSVDQTFLNVSPQMYWTADTSNVISRARRVNFYNGAGYAEEKNITSNIRCVRGVSSSVAKTFTRDNVNNTVADNVTTLMWQDNAIVGAYGMVGAISYCEDLTLSGFNDWRLPNLNELRSISDVSASPPIYSIFKNTENLSYWTSTTFAINTSMAWTVNFNSPGFSSIDKSNSYLVYIRCVRGG